MEASQDSELAIPSTDDVLAQLFPDEYGEKSTETSTEADESESEAEATAEAAPAPEPEPETRKLDPAAEKFMQREQAILQREAQIKAHEEDLRRLDQQLSSLEEEKRRIEIDPISYLRKVAPELDLRKLTYDAWYAYKGEEAPVEHRLDRQVRELKYEQEQLRSQAYRQTQQQVEEKAAKESQQALNQYVSEMETSLSNLDSGKYQLVAKLATASKDKAVNRMLDHARRIAIAENSPPSVERAIAALEADLADLVPAVAPVSSEEPPAQPPRKQTPGTLRNEHSSVQPSRTDPDPNDPHALRKAAMEAAGIDYNDPAVRRYFEEG